MTHTVFNDTVLATSNKGKIAEFEKLWPADKRLLSLDQFTTIQAEETGETFVENALLKARHACHYSTYPALADDSGLVVDALKGAPGVRSARYAGEDATDAKNIEKLLYEMRDVPQEARAAYFYCALVYLRFKQDPAPVIACARWDGWITTEMRGTEGFGYDPIFYVPDKQCTSAQLDYSEKNRISHRGQAMAKMHRMLWT